MRSPFTDLIIPPKHGEEFIAPNKPEDLFLDNYDFEFQNNLSPASIKVTEDNLVSPPGQHFREVILNEGYSLDLGWGFYLYQINDLLLKTIGQSRKSLIEEDFARAVSSWKRKNGFPIIPNDGFIDLNTWSRMAVSIGVSPRLFSISNAYSNMNLKDQGLSADAFRFACNGFRRLERMGHLKNNKILSIVDFTQSSKNRRFYILDMANQKILLQTNVAHGKHSGSSYEWANKFSNIPLSNQSSLGFYITLESYSGKNGLSLKLQGMEEGFNSKARERRIVIHGATYVTETGKAAGRSWGCPAVAMHRRDEVVNTLKDGTCLFLYFNDPDYLNKSSFIGDPPRSMPAFTPGQIPVRDREMNSFENFSDEGYTHNYDTEENEDDVLNEDEDFEDMEDEDIYEEEPGDQ